MVGTMPSSFAKSERRASSVAPAEMPAIAKRRRREIVVGSTSFMTCLHLNLLMLHSLGYSGHRFDLIEPIREARLPESAPPRNVA
jgi:hypothetical protein